MSLGTDIFIAAFTLEGKVFDRPACPGQIEQITRDVIAAIDMDEAWLYEDGAWLEVRS